MIELQSTITCPHCGHRQTEPMPTDFCQFFYDCKGCAELLRPRQGDCCVFCSYGTVPCPPVQEANERRGQAACCQLRRAPMAALESRARRDWADWGRNRRSYALAWGLPTVLLIVAIFVPAPIRTVVWAGCLIWMGAACVANAARCGRTHCHLTGPFYLAMAAVTVGYGTGMVSLGSQGWLWIGAAIAVGTVALWIVPERLFGRFLAQSVTSRRSGKG
jgi:hypothetical protein